MITKVVYTKEDQELSCGKCNKVKPRSEFYPLKNNIRMASSWCKLCMRILTRDRQQTPAMRDRYKELTRKRGQSRKGSVTQYPGELEMRAAAARLGYKVKTGKIAKPKICPICGDDRYKICGFIIDKQALISPENVFWRCTDCKGEQRRMPKTRHEEHPLWQTFKEM